MAAGRLARAGLVATNSIRGGMNRKALERILAHASIFEAWADEPWVVDGADVRVSLICFAPRERELPIALNGRAVPRIGPDLSAAPVDLTQARRLGGNRGAAFQGDIKRGPVRHSGGARAGMGSGCPANPNGRTNADVLRPWANGRDLVRRPSDRWIIDFGCTMEIGGGVPVRGALPACGGARAADARTDPGSREPQVLVPALESPACDAERARRAAALHPHAPGG